MESKRRTRGYREAFGNSITNSTKNNILKQEVFEEITLNVVENFIKNKKLMLAKNQVITNEDSQIVTSSSEININDDDGKEDVSGGCQQSDNEKYDNCESYWDENNINEDENIANMVLNIDQHEDDLRLRAAELSSINLSTRKSCLELTVPSHSIVNLSRHLTNLSIHANLKETDDHEKLIEGKLVSKGAFARAINHWFQTNSVPKASRHALMNILQNSFLGAPVNLPIRLLDPIEKKKKDITFLQYGARIKSIGNRLNDDEEAIGENEDEASTGNEKSEHSDDLIRNFVRSNIDIQDGVPIHSSDEDVSSVSETSSVTSYGSVSTDELDECNAESTVDRYDMKTARFLQIDQCFNDCFVYAGDNLKLFSCPVCNEVRFRPCCRTTCKGRGRSDCDHFIKQGVADGVAYKQMFYRPLLILIADLLKTPHFITALNYERKFHGPQENDAFADFMDGEIAKTHLESMNSNFLDWKQKQDERRQSTCVSVPLLLSEFYDGGQLFKSKVNDFWALLTQFLNLPPTYRGKLGIGMFVQAIYAGKHKAAESFLFIDNFCEELRMLYIGVDINISGVTYFIQARLVLHTLDTRAAEALLSVQSTSNSRAGCPLCQGVTGIHDGNKCVYTGNRHLLPWNHYLRFLGQSGSCCPMDFYHPTKPPTEYDEFSTNQSISIEEDACMQKFYRLLVKEDIVQIKTDRKTQRERSKKAIDLASRKVVWKRGDMKNYDFEFCRPCDADDGSERFKSIKRFLFEGGGDFNWSHKEYDFGDSVTDKTKGLRKYLFYRHFDLRKFNSHKRVSYEQHLKDAEEARSLNRVKRCKKTFHVNGIQNVWYFDRLQYANLTEQYTWPFVHALTGIVKHMSGILLGLLPDTAATKKPGTKRRFKTKSTILEEKKIEDEREKQREVEEEEDGYDGGEDGDNANGTALVAKSNKKEKNRLFNSYRPKQTREDGNAPYEASKTDVHRCREWLQCVLLPPGLDDDSYCVKGFINSDGKMGYMKMNQRLKLISCFWGIVILSMTDLEDQYKLFFRMFADDMSKLLSLNFSKNSIEQIQADIIESICLWEGLLPSKNCTFQLHEIIDMADFIPLFGPPMGVSEFPGERAIGKMISRKLKSNTGGVSFEKTIMQSQIDFELRTIKNFYKEAINAKPSRGKKLAPNNRLHCKVDNITKTLIFDQIPFSISKQELYDSHVNTYIKLSAFEMDSLVNALILEVKKQFGSDHQLCKENSAIYRIESLRLELENKMTTMEWLQHVSDNGGADMFGDDYDIAQNLLTFQPTFFQRAHLYGVSFVSRGSWLRETEFPKIARYGDQNKDYIESNKLGSLNESWRRSTSYGSWCRFEQLEGKHSYGQINTFFRIDIEDTSVDGLVLAAVTCRKYSTVPKSSVHRISCSGSLDINIQFVATTDIYPTRIATMAFNQDGMALNVQRKNVRNAFATSDTSNFDYLYMISLNPEKLTLRPNNRPFKDFQL